MAAQAGSLERRRALIDMGVTLVATMLIWPFPIARQYLAPLVNVGLIFATWAVLCVAYHVICARLWHRTAAMFFLGTTLGQASAPAKLQAPGSAALIKWGFLASACSPAIAIAPRVADWVARMTGLQVVTADGGE